MNDGLWEAQSRSDVTRKSGHLPRVKPSVLHIHKFTESNEWRKDSEECGVPPRVYPSTMTWRSFGRMSPSITFNPRCSYIREAEMDRSGMSFSRLTMYPSITKSLRSASTLSIKSTDVGFFCDWVPQLFGVDEEFIPSSEEEMADEGLFDAEEDMEEGSELKAPEEEDGGRRRPRYGRRARPRPRLVRKDGEEFDCICDIDDTFVRHYVPRYGGGVKSEKEDWRVPHFSTYWEDYKEEMGAIADASLLKVLDAKTQPEGRAGERRSTLPQSKPHFLVMKGKAVRREILESIRPLTCRELRRYRMPYSEAIILELEEDGYVETAAFLKSLLVEEYLLDNVAGPRPTIRENKPIIQKLVRLLTDVEKKGRKQEFNSQSVILLKTGLYFTGAEPSWWWLADRFFEKAVEVASKYVIDGGKSEAVARYIYGMFLLDHAGKIQAAREHLSRAREISLGREWNAGRILKRAQNPIHKECCNYLCRALIETSRSLRAEGKPQEALQFIHQSYKLCQETQTSKADIVLETLFELGMTYQAAGDLYWAKMAFKKFVAKAKMEGYTRSICDGYLELAICFRMEGEMDHCYYHLKSYLNHAEAKNDENLTAFGHRYLGEFLLNHGHSKEAVEHFEKAFESFLEQYQKTGDKPYAEWEPEEYTLPMDVELARVLTGLAKGEILTKPICSLILRARDVRNQVDTLKLLKWKNSQEISFEINEDPKKVVDFFEMTQQESSGVESEGLSQHSDMIEEEDDEFWGEDSEHA